MEGLIRAVHSMVFTPLPPQFLLYTCATSNANQQLVGFLSWSVSCPCVHVVFVLPAQTQVGVVRQVE
jgi:hypothetical protein